MNDDAAAGLLGGLALLFSGVFMIFTLGLLAVMLVSMWRIFAKAGQPGWAAIVPIYNLIVMLQIIGRPLWWIALFMIPVVNFVIAIIVTIDLAKSYGKSTGFAFGLLFLGFIFFPILGFGDARYLGPAGASTASALSTAS